MRSGFVPAMQAAVPRVIAEVAPAVTMAASLPAMAAMRTPTASCNSFIRARLIMA